MTGFRVSCRSKGNLVKVEGSRENTDSESSCRFQKAART